MAAFNKTKWSDFDLNEISLLIQLQYYLKLSIKSPVLVSYTEIYYIVEKLGFNRDISDELSLNKKIAQKVVDKIIDNLDTLRPKFEEENGIFESDLLAKDVYIQLEEGTLNYFTSQLLVNPFSVWNLEKKFDIVETGDVRLMKENWNRKYYSPRLCEIYNTQSTCVEKSIEYDDMERFISYYNIYHDGEMMAHIAKYGRIDMFKYALSNDPKILDKINNIRYVVEDALKGDNGNDNTAMIEYLMTLPQIKAQRDVFWNYIFNVLRYESGINLVNIEKIISYTPVDERVNDILRDIANNGWVDLFKRLANAIDVTDAAWYSSLEAALRNKNFDIVEFILPHLSVANLQQMIVNTIEDEIEYTEDHQKNIQIIKFLISLPQISNAYVEEFSRFITSTRIYNGFNDEKDFDDYINILKNSGKISSRLVEQYVYHLKKSLKKFETFRRQNYNEGYHYGYHPDYADY